MAKAFAVFRDGCALVDELAEMVRWWLAEVSHQIERFRPTTQSGGAG